MIALRTSGMILISDMVLQRIGCAGFVLNNSHQLRLPLPFHFSTEHWVSISKIRTFRRRVYPRWPAGALRSEGYWGIDTVITDNKVNESSYLGFMYVIRQWLVPSPASTIRDPATSRPSPIPVSAFAQSSTPRNNHPILRPEVPAPHRRMPA